MDWNAVICVYPEGFRRAVRVLRQFAKIERTAYHNVLVAAAEDPLVFLDKIEDRTRAEPALYDAISRVAPAKRSFQFLSGREFDEESAAAVLEWVPQLAGRSFHVRVHRRGFKYDETAAETEQRLGALLLETLRQNGQSGRISFSDPDAIIVIDTVDDRAGAAIWTRGDLLKYRVLRPD